MSGRCDFRSRMGDDKGANRKELLGAPTRRPLFDGPDVNTHLYTKLL